ncbi:glycosyltransferase family 4 protein [Flavobacteriaceae bacterium S356]|uniref:Glycosyltransferase family 4 protein n=1 Tax=Asprobacillus argus TaxID=3076534 RepID=A0ABU3LI96_9FLAO|nr:glycosyltransferase family 4 protein [Flavobacteriaceae bacterium S356]
MRVLFVSSGTSTSGITSTVKNQGYSLRENGVEVDFFAVEEKGIKGYLRTIPKLNKVLREKHYDIVHAHYAMSGFLASLSKAKNIVVSLMGNDVLEKRHFKYINLLFYIFSWKRVIVKSKGLAKKSYGIKTEVIPNGIDLNRFIPMTKEEVIPVSGWGGEKKHILFGSNPDRPEKNFCLAEKAINLIDGVDYELHFLKNIPHEKVGYYYNSADVVLLTSLWEGSPNVIKEAMACNVPIVTVNVGDVEDVIDNTKGCYIIERDEVKIARKIEEALSFGKRTDGRSKVLDLDRDIIAKRIINIYKSILKT